MTHMGYRIIPPNWHNSFWMLGIYNTDTDEDYYYKLNYRSLLSLGEACLWVLKGGYGGQVTRCIRIDVYPTDQCPRLNGHPVSIDQLSKLYSEIEGAVDDACNQG